MTDTDKPVLFTRGLMFDVAKAIEAHGYGPINGPRELTELQQHLLHFLHGRARDDGQCTGGVR